MKSKQIKKAVYHRPQKDSYVGSGTLLINGTEYSEDEIREMSSQKITDLIREVETRSLGVSSQIKRAKADYKESGIEADLVALEKKQAFVRSMDYVKKALADIRKEVRKKNYDKRSEAFEKVFYKTAKDELDPKLFLDLRHKVELKMIDLESDS